MATAAVVTAGTVLAMTHAAAAATGATGYAAQNGGTDGGAGGQVVSVSTGTGLYNALCNRSSTSTPIIIQVSGTINHGNTSAVDGDSCDSADGVIELKGVSNVSIIGTGNAVFDQIGIHVRDSSNIILQNFTVKNVKKSGSPTSNGGDAIGMEDGVRNVWADHLTLEASGGEDEGYDGLFDLKNNTQYVTLSYSILRNSERGGLVGSGDSDLDSSFITYHHNLYQNLNSRMPLLRGGTAHSYNNHFTGIVESGINPRVGAKIKVDNNYFEDSKDPLGTFYTDLMGYWQVSGNIFDNVTWSSPGEDNYPAGPNPTSTTSVSIPYAYDLDDAGCVPDIVAQTAGANKGLQVSDGNCSAEPPTTDPEEPTTDPEEPTTDPEEPSGENLSIGAGADGTSKASGTSYGNVIDGSTSTYWSPSGSTGRVSVKWGSATSVSSIVIRTASGGGTIGGWQVVNNDNGAVLASGSSLGSGVIDIPTTSLKKINFVITSASGTPRIAEFETYAGSATNPTDPDPTDPDPTDPDPTDPGGNSDELYVAPGGSSSAAGTISNPTTLVSAIDRITPGGTIYMRGGTYNLSSTVNIEPGNDGTSGDRTEIWAYSGETPVLNFSAQAEDSANRGLAIGGDWWHLKGLIVEHAGDNGILLGGSNNIIERVVTRHNADTGLQIARYTAGAPSSEWPSNNLVLSSESHDNVDSDGEDADGFAAKLTSGDGNVFRFCVAHNNIDDGWDLYTKDDTGPIGEVVIEDSLSYDNGTLSNGGQAGNGDRNGYKLGGEDIAVDHTLVRSIAFENGKHGITYNSNPGSMTISNNLSIGNGERNFNFDAGSSVFRGNTSCDSGSNDRIVGNSDSSNQWDTGSNGSRCSAYSGSLSWSFASNGTLTVRIGGAVVDL
nr:right-handed parallel beta-helix repeat-containing protein [Glycomyces paridis]